MTIYVQYEKRKFLDPSPRKSSGSSEALLMDWPTTIVEQISSTATSRSRLNLKPGESPMPEIASAPDPRSHAPASFEVAWNSVVDHVLGDDFVIRPPANVRSGGGS